MSSSRGAAAIGGKLGMCLMGVIIASSLIGCSNPPSTGALTDFRKGFLDPTAVGRYQKQPLVVPILSSLDRSVDTADEQFRNASDVRPEDLEPTGADYMIGRNDLINVAITDLVAPNVETTRQIRVSESGMISLPLVGQVQAAGLTEAQLEKQIAAAYRQANLIQSAQVSVSVIEARGRTFSILGSVNAPGQYAILNSDFRVLDALVLARDVNAQGIEYIYVVRQIRQQPAAPAATQPVTEPATEDVLTPQGNAAKAKSVIRAQASPSTAVSDGVEDDGQRFMTVEGKQIPVPSTEPAPVAPAPAVAPAPTAAPPAPAVAAPAAAAPAPAAPAPAPAQAGAPFEFRDPVAAGKTRVIRIPYEALRNGDLRYNIIIQPYDLIVVPQPLVGEYYMGGHVTRVGVYSLTARKITLKQAIVSAGMFDAIAIPSQTDIIRRVGGDKEIFVQVDLDKVFEGSQPDVFLKPNDVVQVGTTWWAPFAAAVRGGFRFTYGFGFLYDRNFADYEDPFGMGGRAAIPK